MPAMTSASETTASQPSDNMPSKDPATYDEESSVTTKQSEKLPWKQRAAIKREQQHAQIPQEWRIEPLPSPLPVSTLDYINACTILTPEEHAITNTASATRLLSQIRSRELSSLQVATAFCKRAAIAQQLSRCCTEMFFGKALQRAKELDRYLAETGKPIGPLHGLPVSLKDGTDIEGEDTTLGWVGLAGRPAEKDCLLAECLRKQGAVLYCKTNIPQSLMMSDSYNHLFKQSVNSLNRNLISGGSSGGEGALVGCHGSIVGVGTDIGGSIRIPANVQGLYGLCPTVGRFPWHASVIRDNIVNGVAGPLSRTIDTQEVFWKGLLDAEPWQYEPTSYAIPWRPELAAKPTRKLKIGYYVDDGMVKVQPPIQRAVLETVEKLKAAGHEVFAWDTSSHKEGQRLWLKAILGDGGRRFRKLASQSDEPLVEGMLVGTEDDRLDVDEANEVSNDRLAYQKAYMRRWMDSGIDALLMPVQPWVGFPPKVWVQSNQNVSYTSHWNLVDFAALAIPATTARLDDVGTPEWKNHKPRDVSDEFNWNQYDPELVKGMPVGVQVVGGKFGEEKCLAVAKVIEELMHSDG